MTSQTTAAPAIRVVRLIDVASATRAPVPPGTPTGLTFAELAALEPGLAQLRREIRALHRQPLGDDWCANARWYGHGRFRGKGYRPRLVELVGWCARGAEPALHTSSAYDIAYHHLYGLLPGCRVCPCGRPEDYC